MEKRYLFEWLQKDALQDRKIAIISGPRQVGKTTLAKLFLSSDKNYYSWDDDEFRKAWVRSSLSSIEKRAAGPIVLDEIHKDKRRWKQKLKGIYDQIGSDLPIIVTGSARQDVYRKGSDSLMGRYIPYRLHPFSVAESSSPLTPQKIFTSDVTNFPFKDLMRLGGFPEPLLSGSEQKAIRWSRLRLERLVREDVYDIQSIQDANLFQVFVDLLNERVGSLLSINNLREDSSISYGTAHQWVKVLEALYYCFLVRPYSKKIKRSLTAQPKLYLFDILRVPGSAQRIENLAALHLLKCCQFWTDTAQGEFELFYLRTKEKQEVDFCITQTGKPWMLVEYKSNKEEPSPNLIHFSKIFGTLLNYQLVSTPAFHREYPHYKIHVVNYEKFFSGLV